MTTITRISQGTVVKDSHGPTATHDHVVIGVHADQAMAMLREADAGERVVLGAIICIVIPSSC